MQIKPCPYCERGDFKTTRQRGGHVANCPERGNGKARPKPSKDPAPLHEFGDAGFEVVYTTTDLITLEGMGDMFAQGELDRLEDGRDCRRPLLLHTTNPNHDERVIMRRPRERVENLHYWYGTANMLALPFAHMSYYQSPMLQQSWDIEGRTYLGDLEILIIKAEDFLRQSARWWKQAYEMDRFYKFGG